MPTTVWPQRHLFDLQDARYVFTTDSTDLAALHGYTDLDISGAVLDIREGDYREIWVTESNRPYELTARYVRVLFHTKHSGTN